MRDWHHQTGEINLAEDVRIFHKGVGSPSNAIGKILDECRETGECLWNEETEIGNGFQGMFALHGISPQSPKETWTCQSCGTEGNISNFCPDCGKPRPI